MTAHILRYAIFDLLLVYNSIDHSQITRETLTAQSFLIVLVSMLC